MLFYICNVIFPDDISFLATLEIRDKIKSCMYECMYVDGFVVVLIAFHGMRKRYVRLKDSSHWFKPREVISKIPR